jgi:hypothetical protein
MSDNSENLVNKRNRIALHLEGNKFKAVSASDMGADAKTRELPTTVIDKDLLLQDMLKLISVTPMEDAFKEILRIRITYPDNAVQIFMAFGNKHGIRLATIFQMEEYAKEKVIEFLKKNEIQDAIGKFNADQGGSAVDIKNKMASEKGIVDGNGNAITAKPEGI